MKMKSWKAHIDYIKVKLLKINTILHKVNYLKDSKILYTSYIAMIVPCLNYCVECKTQIQKFSVYKNEP